MIEFEATPKKWGNSVGVIIPAEVLKKEGITINQKLKLIAIGNKKPNLSKIFGALASWKKPTDEIMKEIDEGWNKTIW